MDSFVVEIRETLVRRVSVVAESDVEAEDLVRDIYKCGSVILDDGDFVDVEFTSITS